MDESTTQHRMQHTDAKMRERQIKINRAKELKTKGYSNRAIAEKMNIVESSVRGFLNSD